MKQKERILFSRCSYLTSNIPLSKELNIALKTDDDNFTNVSLCFCYYTYIYMKLVLPFDI